MNRVFEVQIFVGILVHLVGRRLTRASARRAAQWARQHGRVPRGGGMWHAVQACRGGREPSPRAVTWYFVGIALAALGLVAAIVGGVLRAWA